VLSAGESKTESVGDGLLVADGVSCRASVDSERIGAAVLAVCDVTAIGGVTPLLPRLPVDAAIVVPRPRLGDLDESRRSLESSNKAFGSELLVCLTVPKISEFFSFGATFFTNLSNPVFILFSLSFFETVASFIEVQKFSFWCPKNFFPLQHRTLTLKPVYLNQV